MLVQWFMVFIDMCENIINILRIDHQTKGKILVFEQWIYCLLKKQVNERNKLGSILTGPTGK